jgi:hypothetical protein
VASYYCSSRTAKLLRLEKSSFSRHDMGKGGYGEPDWATPGASAMAGTTQETGVPATSGGIVNAAT